MKIIVLGSGCTKCQSTTAMIERVAKDWSVAIDLEKTTDHAEIERLGIYG